MTGNNDGLGTRTGGGIEHLLTYWSQIQWELNVEIADK